MEFEWDPDKSDRCEAERGFDFAFASLIFDGRTVEWIDDRFDYGEERVNAIGVVQGYVLHVTYTDVTYADEGGEAEVRRIISAREATKRERKTWLTSE